MPRKNDRAVGKELFLTALLVGFGIANHWPLMLLSGPAVVLLWLPSQRLIWPRLPGLLIAFALGLLPYAWMVWHSRHQPQISFQGPIEDWDTFVGYFLRSGYAGVDDTASSAGSDRLLFLAYLVAQASRQLLLPGAALALIGAFAQWRRWGMLVAAALSAAFLGPTLLLVLLLGFDFQPLQREAFRVYPLVAWGIFALWAGLGLAVLSERLSARRRVPLSFALAATLITATLITHWGQNARYADRLAHDYASTLLAGLDPHARLLIRGDIPTPATSYLHLVEGMRPDVTLISEDALVLEPKLFDPAQTPIRVRKQLVNAYIESSDRPIYRLHNRDARSGTFSWLLFHLDPQSTPGTGEVRFHMTAQERKLLVWLAEIDHFRDGWSEILRRALLAEFTDFQTRAELVGQWSGDDAELEAIRGRVLELPEAALRRAELLFSVDAGANAAEIGQLIRRFAERVADPGLSKRHLARFYNLMAHIAQRDGREVAFRTAIQASWEYWPAAENPAFSAAEQLQQIDRQRKPR